MEGYQAFLDRIGAFETPEMHLGDGDFAVSPSVAAKVSGDNTFRAFYGDTVVFDLDAQAKERIQGFAAAVHTAAPEAFCEPLVGSTFHMTLHDLSNSPVMEEVAERMEANERRLRELLAAHPVERQTIRMRTKAIFNMVNTSLVLGLCPADETEYQKLMQLYQLVDAVQTLPYPLTPHITLAYYSSSGFDGAAAGRLVQAVNRLNAVQSEIVLDTGRLFYQHFTSMNDYRNVVCLCEN